MDTEEAVAGLVFDEDNEAVNLAVSRGTAAQPYWIGGDMVLVGGGSVDISSE